MSVYRELFVEVPTALLEAAVLEAQQRKSPSAERSIAIQTRAPIRLLSSAVELGYGWTQARASRSAYADAIHIDGYGPCGHWYRAEISEMAVHLSPQHCGDVIRQAIQSPHRDCFCVPQEPWR